MCDHSHGSHCCHSHQQDDPSSSMSLYKYIDMNNVECLNESVTGSGKFVFKPYEDRKDSTVFVESDADEELLFNIPFTGNIKLRGIIIAGENTDHHPNTVALYKNKPFMTFSDVNVECEQTLELAVDPYGDIIYPLKVTKFSNIHGLSIHVRTNYGAETTRIHYIGLKGDYTPAPRKEIVIANYELTPNIADHKCESFRPQTHFVE